MRLTILALGTRGDVQPYVALGQALQSAGDDVCIATHERLRAFIEDHGFAFHSLAGDPKVVFDDLVGNPDYHRKFYLRYSTKTIRWARSLLVDIGRACIDASRSSDLVIANPLSEGIAFHINEFLGVPVIRTQLAPWTPSRYYSVILKHGQSSRPTYLNLLSHRVMRQVFWTVTRQPLNQLRRQQLNLPMLPWRDPYRRMDESGWPLLLMFSPHVFPPVPDWGDWVHCTGYWFLDHPESWRPPADLQRFLDAGSPPVSVGFGSVPTAGPAETTRLIIAALRRAGQRGVLVSGWGGLDQRSLPEDMFMLDQIPYDWLFPRMAAVVHHGGAGTTAAGFRAGVPSVVIPSSVDQPFWGSRVHALGVGPPPIPRRQLSEERLGAAIAIAVNDPDIRRRAADLGEAIRAEDGVGHAVELIHAYSGQQAAHPASRSAIRGCGHTVRASR